VGSADHRLVVLRHGTGELVGREDRQDRQREAAADTLDAGQPTERVALGCRAEAEQRPGVLADLKLGEDCDVAAERPKGGKRPAAELNEIAHAGDVDDRIIAGGFGEDSGETRDHDASHITATRTAKDNGPRNAPSRPRGFLISSSLNTGML